MKQRDSDKAWAATDQARAESKAETKEDVVPKEPDQTQEISSAAHGDTGLTFKDRVPKQALDTGGWRYEFDPAKLNADDLDLIYDEEESRGKHKNHRTYVGPDSQARDRGDDKIPVEVKYNNQDNKVTYSGVISHYQKTTFARYYGREWILVSKHADIKGITQLKTQRRSLRGH